MYMLRYPLGVPRIFASFGLACVGVWGNFMVSYVVSGFSEPEHSCCVRLRFYSSEYYRIRFSQSLVECLYYGFIFLWVNVHHAHRWYLSFCVP